jgi:hypothetical protein
MGAQRIEPTERQFRAVARELEQAIWRLLLRPSVGAARVLQMGAVVELMPNVFVQAVRLAQEEAADRYVRVWCVVPAGDGDSEERTLLCFYTPGFPDPQYTQIRPGMDLNLAWWDAVRVRLAEIADEIGMGRELGSPAGGKDMLPAPALGADDSALTAGPAPPAAASATAATTAASPLHSAEGPNGATAPPAEDDPRSKEVVLREALVLFRDAKRARDESYARRDQTEQRLTEMYFARYPYMRQATQHATELSVGALIERWVREGCPTPQQPGTQTSGDGPEPGPDTNGEQRDGPSPSPSPSPSPWPLALELESAKAVIAEQTRLLERLCELSGGHAPLPKRDTTTGRLVTVCERCDAQLAARAPSERDRWLN